MIWASAPCIFTSNCTWTWMDTRRPRVMGSEKAFPTKLQRGWSEGGRRTKHGRDAESLSSFP
eukprot:2992969-Alexandrium_andersonii.AAC.1